MRRPFGAMGGMKTAQWTIVSEVSVFRFDSLTTYPVCTAREVRSVFGKPRFWRVDMIAALEVRQEKPRGFRSVAHPPSGGGAVQFHMRRVFYLKGLSHGGVMNLPRQ